MIQFPVLWTMRRIAWCKLCGKREENGSGADLCAHCEADVRRELGVTNG